VWYICELFLSVRLLPCMCTALVVHITRAVLCYFCCCYHHLHALLLFGLSSFAERSIEQTRLLQSYLYTAATVHLSCITSIRIMLFAQLVLLSWRILLPLLPVRTNKIHHCTIDISRYSRPVQSAISLI
jgi:hypothetical protein